MIFTLLGTGTSQGIPVIGCNCPTCTSTDPRDRRLRCSALVQSSTTSVVIDVGPDFRQQMLTHQVREIDAVIITHEHNDHVIGLDDLRPLIFRSGRPMTIYAEQRVLAEIKNRFAYAFETHQYPGAPEFRLMEVVPGQLLQIGDIHIRAVRVMHGRLPILGYVIEDQIGYLTDTNDVPAASYEHLAELDVLILDMLRHKPHHSHNHFDRAVTMAKQLQAKQTFFTHMSHMLGPTSVWEKDLPDDMWSSYDGQQFELSEC
ncbi:MAG: MBL fold metallo-hydrolase [Bacteroidota bacterium]